MKPLKYCFAISEFYIYSNIIAGCTVCSQELRHTCPELLLTLAVATTPRIVTVLLLVTPSLTANDTPPALSWGSDPGGKRPGLLKLSKSSSWS